MKLYPLKLTPVLKNAVWGGKKIPERFGIGEIGKSCAEAWMLARVRMESISSKTARQSV